MAGKRQHFVPRFLQAGFASRRERDEVFTWVFRKGRPAFECNTRNVGLEGEFYTTPGDTAADDAITDAEGPFSSLVTSLRDSPVGPVSRPEIPALIAHFEVRTRHIRQSLLQAGNEFVSQMASFLGDQNAFGEYLERKFRTDPTLLRRPLAETLSKQGYSRKQADAFLQRLLPRAMGEVVRPVIPLLAEGFRREIPARLAAAAKSGHIRALKEDVAPALKTERFRSLAYATLKVNAGDMILGDSIVLFEVEGPRRFKTLLEGKDALKAVYVPLAPAIVLVGAPGPPSSVQGDLREAIGRSSFEYFIGHEESDENVALQEQVGGKAPLLSPEEIDEIMTELMNS